MNFQKEKRSISLTDTKILETDFIKVNNTRFSR
jgi:hypothetical protein